MLPTSLVIQIPLIISITSAIVIPSQLYKMVNYVVDTYVNDSCLVVISSGGYTVANYVPAVYVAPYNPEMQDQNHSFNPEDIYRMGTIAPVLELGCTGYLIQGDNPGRQLRLIEQTFKIVNQRTQRRFIFLPTITRSAGTPIGVQDEVLDSGNFDFRSILLEKSVQYIPDMIFAAPNDQENRVAIFTHRFTGPDEVCRQDMLLDTYDVARERFDLGVNLFPDKVKNLEGKVLRIALFNYPPSVVVVGQNETARVDGTEWRFAQHFIEHHNCSFKLVIHNRLDWGRLYENLTGFGMFGTLVEDKADLGITSLFYAHRRYMVLDFTFPSHIALVKCLVPGSRQLPQWMSPILPFSPVVWATFIGMTILSVVFIVVVNRAESFIRSEDSFRMSISEAVSTVAKIMLHQGVTRNSNGPAWAALSIALLTIALLITTAYESSLASAITVPRYELPIDTVSELAASGIPWGATNRAWLTVIRDAEEPEMKTLIENFQELSEAELVKHSADGDDWAFPIEQVGDNYILPHYLSTESIQKMHVMKNDIYWSYSTTMLRKSSPFTRPYAQRVLKLHETGIPNYWHTIIALQHLDTFQQMAVGIDNFRRGGPVKITVHHLQGPFFVLVIGLVLSSLVFLRELYAHPKA